MPSFNIKAMIWLMIISDLGLRIEKRLKVILRAFSELNKIVLYMCSEGQSKIMWDISQGLSVKCKVRNGASFKSSL